MSQPFDLGSIEKTIKDTLDSLEKKSKSNADAHASLLADEANLKSKIDKKKMEFDRAQKRLMSLQSVRPAYMDEYERVEAELVRVYQVYMERFRNLAFLEQQLDEHNKLEQEKIIETEADLKKMQSRLREEERNILRGNKGFALDKELSVDRKNTELGDSESDQQVRVFLHRMISYFLLRRQRTWIPEAPTKQLRFVHAEQRLARCRLTRITANWTCPMTNPMMKSISSSLDFPNIFPFPTFSCPRDRSFPTL